MNYEIVKKLNTFVVLGKNNLITIQNLLYDNTKDNFLIYHTTGLSIIIYFGICPKSFSKRYIQKIKEYNDSVLKYTMTSSTYT